MHCNLSSASPHLGLAAALSLAAGCATAQPATDVPALLMHGTCAALNFDRSTLDLPETLDMLVRVDEGGKAVSARALDEGGNRALQEAVAAMLHTCTYRPALTDGKPVAGSARTLQRVAPSQVGPSPAKATASQPAIVDVRSCAPTSDDYPRLSRQYGETGTTKIGFTVDETGRLSAFAVAKSSGHLRLDFIALLKLAGCRFKAGRAEDGTPVGGTFFVDYIWKLE